MRVPIFYMQPVSMPCNVRVCNKCVHKRFVYFLDCFVELVFLFSLLDKVAFSGISLALYICTYK